MNLEKYVELYREGDELAFNVLYDETYSLVRYVIYTYIQNPDTIEDLAQETFTKVSEKISEYQSKNFRNWIYTLAKNIAIDYVRKKKSDNIERVDCFADTLENPYLSYAISHLDELHREVFLLKVLCDHTTQKIALSLGLTIKKVNNLYYEAKKILKKELEASADEIRRI